MMLLDSAGILCILIYCSWVSLCGSDTVQSAKGISSKNYPSSCHDPAVLEFLLFMILVRDLILVLFLDIGERPVVLQMVVSTHPIFGECRYSACG